MDSSSIFINTWLQAVAFGKTGLMIEPWFRCEMSRDDVPAQLVTRQLADGNDRITRGEIVIFNKLNYDDGCNYRITDYKASLGDVTCVTSEESGLEQGCIVTKDLSLLDLSAS